MNFRFGSKGPMLGQWFNKPRTIRLRTLLVFWWCHLNDLFEEKDSWIGLGRFLNVRSIFLVFNRLANKNVFADSAKKEPGSFDSKNKVVWEVVEILERLSRYLVGLCRLISQFLRPENYQSVILRLIQKKLITKLFRLHFDVVLIKLFSLAMIHWRN